MLELEVHKIFTKDLMKLNWSFIMSLEKTTK
jgi:hypothetical protein